MIKPADITACAEAGYKAISSHPEWDRLEWEKAASYMRTAADIIDKGVLDDKPEKGVAELFQAAVHAKAVELGVWPSKPRDQRKREALQRIEQVLPHVRRAMEEARQNGVPHIGVLSIGEGRTGRVECSFQADAFFDDLALALDMPLQTEDDDMTANAAKLLQQFGGGV